MISVRPAPKLGHKRGFKLIYPGKMRLSGQSFNPSNVAYGACFPVYNWVFLVSIIGEAFIRAKQSLTCLIDPNNTCVCCHYEPLNKRSFLGGCACADKVRKEPEVPDAAYHSNVSGGLDRCEVEISENVLPRLPNFVFKSDLLWRDQA
jgi:hypothetical protein